MPDDLNQTFDFLELITKEQIQSNKRVQAYPLEVKESTNENIKLNLKVDINLIEGFVGIKYPYVHKINILGYTPDKGSEYTFKTPYEIIPGDYYLNRLRMCKIVITKWGSLSKTLVGDLVIRDGVHTEEEGTISINQAAENKGKKGGNKKTKRGNKKRHNKTAKRRRRV